MERLNSPFEIFKSNVCHGVKEMGDLPFIDYVLRSGAIEDYWARGEYGYSFYLLAMIDYLARVNNRPRVEKYEEMRHLKLPEPVYPLGIFVYAAVMEDDTIYQKSYDEAIPEFRAFNIVENEIRNVA